MIFGDDGKGRVLENGSLLKNVFLVEGLTINLLSVSQLCDEDLLVQFTKDKCIIHNQNHRRIMEEERTSNNCYLLTSISIFMNKMLHDQGTWIQQFKYTNSSENTIAGQSI